MKVFSFCFGMLLIIVGVMFMVTSYTLYESGTAGAASMLLFGLAVFVVGKCINHATDMTRFLKCVRFGTKSNQVS
jgi:VIT1/CCC1 family predicted Fe2+/Mn2+ transporter